MLPCSDHKQQVNIVFHKVYENLSWADIKDMIATLNVVPVI